MDLRLSGINARQPARSVRGGAPMMGFREGGAVTMRIPLKQVVASNQRSIRGMIADEKEFLKAWDYSQLPMETAPTILLDCRLVLRHGAHRLLAAYIRQDEFIEAEVTEDAIQPGKVT